MTDDPSVIGEECHIVAKEPGGPRGASDLSPEQRDLYANLILCCRNHHKTIDDQPNTYTVERLLEMKGQHEDWVRKSLDFDTAKQRDDELYAALVEDWAARADLDNWRAWTSGLLGPQPELRRERLESIEGLSDWLFGRIWPRRYASLEAGFENFFRVLQDFLRVFWQHAEDSGQRVETARFYRIREWNPARYAHLLRQYEYHVALLEDLTLELTRAANYVCDHVREHVDPSYRLKEGVLVVESGPYFRLDFRQHRVEYRGAERTELPYPGLEAFPHVRAQRDYSFGDGPPPGSATQ